MANYSKIHTDKNKVIGYGTGKRSASVNVINGHLSKIISKANIEKIEDISDLFNKILHTKYPIW